MVCNFCNIDVNIIQHLISLKCMFVENDHENTFIISRSMDSFESLFPSTPIGSFSLQYPVFTQIWM